MSDNINKDRRNAYSASRYREQALKDYNLFYKNGDEEEYFRLSENGVLYMSEKEQTPFSYPKGIPFTWYFGHLQRKDGKSIPATAAQRKIVLKHCPWLENHVRETVNILKPRLFSLFLYSLENGYEGISKLIIRRYSLSEEDIKKTEALRATRSKKSDEKEADTKSSPQMPSFNSMEEFNALFTKEKALFAGLEKHITAIRKEGDYGDFKPYSEGDIEKFDYRNCSCLLDDGNIIVFREEWYKDYGARVITAARDYINLKGFQTFEEYMKSKGLFTYNYVEDEKGRKWEYRGTDGKEKSFRLRYVEISFG